MKALSYNHAGIIECERCDDHMRVRDIAIIKFASNGIVIGECKPCWSEIGQHQYKTPERPINDGSVLCRGCGLYIPEGFPRFSIEITYGHASGICGYCDTSFTVPELNVGSRQEE